MAMVYMVRASDKKIGEPFQFSRQKKREISYLKYHESMEARFKL